MDNFRQQLDKRTQYYWTWCNLHFSSLYSLNRHQKLVKARLGKFKCKFWGVLWHWHSRLEQHYKTHEDILRFKWSFCSKRFEISSKLNQHLPHCKLAKIAITNAIKSDYESVQSESLFDSIKEEWDYNQLVSEIVKENSKYSDSYLDKTNIEESDIASFKVNNSEESDISMSKEKSNKSIKIVVYIL